MNCLFLRKIVRPSQLSYDGLNEHLCELLTMTSQLTVAFATTLVEHQHFVALDERNKHFKHNLCAFHCGSAYSYYTIVVCQQHFLNLNSCTCLHILNVVNIELLALFGFELLTLNFCNYVHFVFELFRVGPAGEAPLVLAFLSLSGINRLQSYGFLCY